MSEIRWQQLLAGVASLGVLALIGEMLAKPAPPQAAPTPPPAPSAPPPPLQITSTFIDLIQQPELDLDILFGASILGGSPPYSTTWTFDDGFTSQDALVDRKFTHTRVVRDDLLQDVISVPVGALSATVTVTDAAGEKVSTKLSARDLKNVVIIFLAKAITGVGFGIVGGTPPYKLTVIDQVFNLKSDMVVGSWMDGVGVSLATINDVPGRLLFTIEAIDQRGVSSGTINIFALTT
jgi:hypothetical protein